MVVTLGQQYIVGERPTVILYTYINRHAGSPNTTKTKHNVLSLVPNQVMSEMVLDRGGRFSPAGLVGVHTLSLLLSSQATHDRAAGNKRSHTTRDTTRHLNTHKNTNTWAQYIRLDREILTPSPCE